MTYEHFLEEYRRKLRTPEEAVSVVKDGDWVDYTCSLGKPEILTLITFCNCDRP